MHTQGTPSELLSAFLRRCPHLGQTDVLLEDGGKDLWVSGAGKLPGQVIPADVRVSKGSEKASDLIVKDSHTSRAQGNSEVHSV